MTASRRRLASALAAASTIAIATLATATGAAHAVSGQMSGRASDPAPQGCHTSQDGSSVACDDAFRLYPGQVVAFTPFANDPVAAGSIPTYCGNGYDGRTQVLWNKFHTAFQLAVSPYVKPGRNGMAEYVSDTDDCADNDAVARAAIDIMVLKAVKPGVTLLRHGGIRISNPNQATLGCFLTHGTSRDDDETTLNIAAHSVRVNHPGKDAGKVDRLECAIGVGPDLVDRRLHLKK